MTTLGWIFMITTWTILTVTVVCCYRLLLRQKRPGDG